MFKNRFGKVRSGWKIAATLSTALLLTLVVQLIAVLIAVALMPAEGSLDERITAATEQFGWLLTLLQEAVMIAVPVFAWKKLSKRPLKDMGLPRLRGHGRELAFGLALGIIAITLACGAILISGSAYVASWTPKLTGGTLLYLGLFISVGFSEEILSRGYVMSALRQTRSMAAVIAISSVIFSCLHALNSGFDLLPFINIVLAGLLFAYMYIRSNNIWMPIGFHITWNYFQGSICGFPVSGNNTGGVITTVYSNSDLLNGGMFGPEGGLAVTAVLLLCFLVVKLFYRNTKTDFFAAEQTQLSPQKVQ
jgi:uncharacterized protein